MPLPNLGVKNRLNSSQTSISYDPMPNSYREQVRDRIQNTPRNNNEIKSNTIDLNLTGESSSFYRPTSRGRIGPRLTNTSLNQDELQRQPNFSSSTRPTRTQQQRQIVFYNKAYVPSISDKYNNNGNNNDSDDNNDIVVRDEKMNNLHSRRPRIESNRNQNDENLLR